jgi:hypothetical protein
MLASDEAALSVAGVAVGVIGRLTEDVDPAGLLTQRMMRLLGMSLHRRQRASPK